MARINEAIFDGPLLSDDQFLSGLIEGLTDERKRLLVSEWAREKRYLPAELTVKPGKFDPGYMPYMTEIMDRMSAGSDCRKLVVEKGAQIGATTAILENCIGYTIDHDPCGIMYMSADKELTKIGIELKVDRMLFHSGLQQRFASADGKTKRSGDTAMLKEFAGGFLLAVGARNPGKLRSTSCKRMVLDELDGMPLVIGNVGSEEGSPVTVSEKRTSTYEKSRLILYISTPVKLQTSQIHPLFLKGDQRRFFVPCVHCGYMQWLKWHGIHPDTQQKYGFVFRVDEHDLLIEESIEYICANCFKGFHDYDKEWFLPRGEWRPTARSRERGLYSYHIPSFLSPPGMWSWAGVVNKWLAAWDIHADRARDIEALQGFYNLERGEPWEERGESPKFEKMVQLRRQTYRSGEINNTMITQETGAPAVLLTCAVDTHGDRLDLEVTAWCVGRQTYSVEWRHLEGDVDDVEGKFGPWAQLREILENQSWIADDGRVYRVQTTLIDCGYKSDRVHQFCSDYASGVYPIAGRAEPVKGALHREFSQFESKYGTYGFHVNTTMYKDRLAAWLKREWMSSDKIQPVGYRNYPQDYPDDFFREMEAEERIEVFHARTKKRVGFEWRQIGQRPNHAWDCSVYNGCAFDMVAIDYCFNELGMEQLDYASFFQAVAPKRDEYNRWSPSPFSEMPVDSEVTET